MPLYVWVQTCLRAACGYGAMCEGGLVTHKHAIEATPVVLCTAEGAEAVVPNPLFFGRGASNVGFCVVPGKDKYHRTTEADPAAVRAARRAGGGGGGFGLHSAYTSVGLSWGGMKGACDCHFPEGRRRVPGLRIVNVTFGGGGRGFELAPKSSHDIVMGNPFARKDSAKPVRYPPVIPPPQPFGKQRIGTYCSWPSVIGHRPSVRCNGTGMPHEPCQGLEALLVQLRGVRRG